MFRSVLLFGLIAGVVVAALTSLITTFGDPTQPTVYLQVIKSLTVAVVLFSCLFGIKWIRDRLPKSVISLPQAIVVGLCICALASLIHCVSWEIYYFSGDYQFARMVSQHEIESAQLAGATAIEIAQLMERNGEIVEAFANPILRISVAFSQMFVVGAIVSVIGAMLIRNPDFLPSQGNMSNN